ncbi:MAG: tetratricopeptide repeat protein [Candidatus Hadarchaeota archaeon]
MPSKSTSEKSDAVSNYMMGLELMKKGHAKEAIPYLEKVLKISPRHTGAKVLLDDAKASLKWTRRYFCTHCGRLLPKSDEQEGARGSGREIDLFCPKCHHRTSLKTQTK